MHDAAGIRSARHRAASAVTPVSSVRIRCGFGKDAVWRACRWIERLGAQTRTPAEPGPVEVGGHCCLVAALAALGALRFVLPSVGLGGDRLLAARDRRLEPRRADRPDLPAGVLPEAVKRLPEDLRAYSSAPDDIDRALTERRSTERRLAAPVAVQPVAAAGARSATEPDGCDRPRRRRGARRRGTPFLAGARPAQQTRLARDHERGGDAPLAIVEGLDRVTACRLSVMRPHAQQRFRRDTLPAPASCRRERLARSRLSSGAMKVVLPDRSELELPDGASGLDAARAIGPKLAEQAVLMRANGVDARPAPAARRRRRDPDPDDARHARPGCALTCCAIPTAHLLAEAVRRLHPGVKVAIGPPIENGFYYDFEFPEPIGEADLERIEEEIAARARRGPRVERARRSRARRRVRASRPKASRTRSSSSTRPRATSRSTRRVTSPISAAARTCRTPRRSRPSS